MKNDTIKLTQKSNDWMDLQYKFGLWETRLFTHLFALLSPNPAPDDLHRIRLTDLAETADAYAANAFLDAAKNLLRSVFSIKIVDNQQKQTLQIPVLYTLSWLTTEGVTPAEFWIETRFHPLVMPYLMRIKNQTNTQTDPNQMRLPSAFSVRFYTWVKTLDLSKQQKISVQDLRVALGVEDDYPFYGNFKQRVLQKAQADLAKHSGIEFKFEEIKKNRAVVELIFTFQKTADFIENTEGGKISDFKSQIPHFNSPNSHSGNVESSPNVAPTQNTEGGKISDFKSQIPHSNAPDSRSGNVESSPNVAPQPITNNSITINQLIAEIHPSVKDYVNRSTVEHWLRDLPIEQVRRGIQYTLNQLANGAKIENVGGYLQRMVKMTDLVDPLEEKKRQVAAQKERAQQQAEEKSRLEQALKIFQQQREAQMEALVETILKDNMSLLTYLIQETRIAEPNDLNAFKTFYETYDNSPSYKGLIHNKLVTWYPQIFEELSVFDGKINALRQQLLRF